MAIEITIPRLGWSMDEGTFIGWLKKEGEPVQSGDLLFTLESEKAAQEIESLDAGILRIPPDAPRPGDKVKVGQLLGYLAAEEEALPAPASPVPAAPAPAAVQSAPVVASLAPVPAARADVPASPRARRAAGERNVDLARLEPTGKGGRIRERDVLAAIGRAAAAPSADPTLMREVPITAMRRTIATRMVNSLDNTAPVTITCRADATNLVGLRQQLKAIGTNVIVPAYTDIIAKLVASALRAHPILTARWDGDRFLLPEQIHIGIAVDTEAGLLVPVLRDVSASSLSDVARQSRRLVEAARAARLTAADMQGGCFTITNLGSFGIEAFTPIINHPETAILGLGAILREPVALEDGTITSSEKMTLSLTFDHRIVDGAPAARFLQTLRQRIEEPVASLLSDG